MLDAPIASGRFYEDVWLGIWYSMVFCQTIFQITSSYKLHWLLQFVRQLFWLMLMFYGCDGLFFLDAFFNSLEDWINQIASWGIPAEKKKSNQSFILSRTPSCWDVLLSCLLFVSLRVVWKQKESSQLESSMSIIGNAPGATVYTAAILLCQWTYHDVSIINVYIIYIYIIYIYILYIYIIYIYIWTYYRYDSEYCALPSPANSQTNLFTQTFGVL